MWYLKCPITYFDVHSYERMTRLRHRVSVGWLNKVCEVHDNQVMKPQSQNCSGKKKKKRPDIPFRSFGGSQIECSSDTDSPPSSPSCIFTSRLQCCSAVMHSCRLGGGGGHQKGIFVLFNNSSNTTNLGYGMILAFLCIYVRCKLVCEDFFF